MKPFYYAVIILIIISYPLIAGEIDELYQVSENGKVFIGNIAGSVDIKGWDRNEISIKGTYGIGIKKIEIISTSNKTKINVIPKIPPFPVTNRANLEILVPFNNNIEVNTITAKISVSDLKKHIYLSSTSGDIDISGNSEDVEIDTTGGDIKIDGTGNYVKINSVSGDIKINGDFIKIYSKTISGKISLIGENIEFGEFSSTSGDINLECSLTSKANITAETISSNIELKTTKDISAKYDLQSFSGTIKLSGIKFDNTDLDKKNSKRIKRKFRDSSGTGDVRIIFQTLSGDISIKGE